MYGPTETTVWSTTHRADRSLSTVPIGRPIVNTRLYVLDQQLRPVPIGVPGELFIGGEGVARGYFHLPELTQERFLADPFCSDPRRTCIAQGTRCGIVVTGRSNFWAGLISK